MWRITAPTLRGARRQTKWANRTATPRTSPHIRRAPPRKVRITINVTRESYNEQILLKNWLPLIKRFFSDTIAILFRILFVLVVVSCVHSRAFCVSTGFSLILELSNMEAGAPAAVGGGTAPRLSASSSSSSDSDSSTSSSSSSSSEESSDSESG